MKRIITLTQPSPAILKAFMLCLALIAGLEQSYANLNLNFYSNISTESESFASCDNVTDGGKIGSTELVCGSYDPAVIENIESPSGGWGALEFLWLKSTDPELPWDQWTMINGADGNSYDPGPITETTYFLRCSRREGCTYYYGESNIIAKIVAPVDTDCTAGILTTNTSFAKTVTIDGHVSYEQNILGAPDGHIAKFYDENDYIAVEMEEEIKAGESIVITWKYRNYTSSFSGPSQLEVWWSTDGTNFTKETTLQTRVKTFLVSQSVTLSNDARYIKLKSGVANPDFDVDAISYCQATCELVCDNVTSGGKIEGNEFSCGGFQSAVINNIELPSGGSGDLEYFWLKSTDPSIPALEWDTAVIGAAAGPSLDPGFITETTYFLRCSRRFPCELWIGESNAIAKVVVDNSDFVCELGSGTPDGFTSGNASVLDTQNGAIDANNALGTPDGKEALLNNDNDFIQIDLGETLKAGETYVISWRANNPTRFTPIPAKINIFESNNNTDFALANTSESFVKYTIIHETFTATQDVRFLKIENPVGSIEIAIDGVSYCKAECPECDNITNGGKVAGNEFSCGGFQAGAITNLELPSGGSGDIEYFWLKSTDPSIPALEWDTAAIGAVAGPSFDPGFITETTYFLRCSRRYPCELWVGESNAIAKVVVDNSNFDCAGVISPGSFTSGNGSLLDASLGAINPENAIGIPDGIETLLNNENDFVQIDLGETLKAGETYVISWRANNPTPFTPIPAKLSIFESENDTDFTLGNTSESFVKYTIIHETFTATQDVRFLKLQNPAGSIEIAIDGISYCKAECPECDNITDGGKIGTTEFEFGPYDPQAIGSITLPSGGNNGQVEYLWLKSTDPSLPALEWDTVAIGPSAGPTFDPEVITETTYFLRCSRRFPCELWEGESNAIAKVVLKTDQLCVGGEIENTFKGFASSLESEDGVENPNNILGAFDNNEAQLNEDNDVIIIDLGTTIKAGQSYTISWRANNPGAFTPVPSKLEIYESPSTSDFVYNGFEKTFVKYTTIHTEITASVDFRYLRLVKSEGYAEIAIDAVTYGQANCNFPTICELNDHGKADKGHDDRLIWLKNPATGVINEYSMNISDSRFTQFLDGTALLTGTAVNIHDDCDIWTYSVRLIEKQNWTDWSAAGGSFKPNNKINNEDHTTWEYYKLDDNNSQFTGEACNTGEVLNLTHNPADYEFGFQVGVGANLKNGDFGISGWFFFTGSYTGKGDFNGNIENCVEQSALLNIGDFVWEDLNGNGIQDAGEPGIEGVQAQLIGTDLAGNGIDIIAFTDANGAYNFGPLNPGTYKVIFSNLPGAYFATSRNTGSDDELDSDVDPITGMTPNKVYGGGQNDDTVDAGYIRFAEIGDFVWEDLNANGLFDFGEPMVEGVEIRLTGVDSRNESIDLTTATNASGIYFFNGLYPGQYKLTFNLPAGFEATAKNIGLDPTIDSDIDPATNMTDEFTLESGDSNGNFDAGIFRRLQISGILFDDTEDDGLFNNADLGVEGFKVDLLRKDASGVFQFYESDLTLFDGSFSFINLPPAEYKISADPTSLPADFNFSLKKDVDANLSEDIDNDANANGMIESVILASGQPDVDDLGIAIVFNAILPVELIEFNAQVIEGNQTLLNWTTESELNNKHFVIERSIDGQTFDAIGVVEGNGTSNSLNYYNYIDETPFYGKNYYRLKQIDFDGQYELSEVKSIIIEADLPDAILYPNPVKTVTTMRVVSPFIADATLEIVSLTGQILRTEVIPMGTNSAEIDLSEYQSGVYFINISYDGFKKMVHRVFKVQD